MTDIVHPPQDLVESRGGLRLNGEYYIKKHVSVVLVELLSVLPSPRAHAAPAVDVLHHQV